MAVLTQAEFDTKYEQLFADNEFRNINEGTFRTLKDDIKDSFVNLKSLTVKQVRGAVYPVPFTDNLNLIPVNYRILGMEAVARNGTDSATGGAGVVQPPITYQLIRDSAGDIDALVDEQPDTLVTVKARWVRTSGTAQEQMDSFPYFEQEDRTPNYQVGDRFSYEFPGSIMRLAQVKVAQGYLAATPTGEDDDPNYFYFAPLSGGGGGIAGATAPLLYDAGTQVVSIQLASGAQAGALSAADWITFNAKQPALGFTPQNLAQKNQPNGYVGLDSNNFIDPARIPAIPIGTPIISSGAIANLTSGQQADSLFNRRIIVTTDGRRWQYTGSGSKVDEGSYIELSDLTPLWSAIQGKPTFGTGSTYNVPAAGNAAVGELVLGSDTRLSDARNTTWAYVKALVTTTITAASGAITAGDTLETVLGKFLYFTLNFVGTANTWGALQRFDFGIKFGASGTTITGFQDIYIGSSPAYATLRGQVVAGSYPPTTGAYAEFSGALPTGSIPGMKFKYGQAKYECEPGESGNTTWVRSPVG